MSVEANKTNVIEYLRAVEAFDMPRARKCFTDNAIQHFPQPGEYSYVEDDSGLEPGTQVGGDAIIEGFRVHIPQIYHVETIKMDIQMVIGEGEWVAAAWILSAKTRKGNVDYANHYHFRFRCENGLIAEYWEYCDTMYGRDLLY